MSNFEQGTLDLGGLEDVETDETAPEQFKIEIIIENNGVRYWSDFDEAGMVFWLEAVKDLVIGRKFNKIGLKPEE